MTNQLTYSCTLVLLYFSILVLLYYNTSVLQVIRSYILISGIRVIQNTQLRNYSLHKGGGGRIHVIRL